MWSLRRVRERAILVIDPAKQCAAFFGGGRDQTYTGRGRQKCYRRWVNDLENVETESMSTQRKRQKSSDRYFSASRRFPAKKKGLGSKSRERSIHRDGVAASATELMPCSSAAFVTSATVS